MPRDKASWWQYQIKKYGSEEAVREAMRAFRAKATPSRVGGFYHMKEHDPQRLKAISSKGGKSAPNTIESQDPTQE